MGHNLNVSDEGYGVFTILNHEDQTGIEIWSKTGKTARHSAVTIPFEVSFLFVTLNHNFEHICVWASRLKAKLIQKNVAFSFFKTVAILDDFLLLCNINNNAYAHIHMDRK